MGNFLRRRAADVADPAATVDVTPFEDVVADDGACSLREAIGAVNAQAASGALAGDGDTVMLAAVTYRLTIIGPGETGNASGDLDLRASMPIAGSASAPSTIARTCSLRGRGRTV